MAYSSLHTPYPRPTQIDVYPSRLRFIIVLLLLSYADKPFVIISSSNPHITNVIVSAYGLANPTSVVFMLL